MLSTEIKSTVNCGPHKTQRRYPAELKERILIAATKYGDDEISKTIDIPRGTLCNWRKYGIDKNSSKKILMNKSRPIIINELPNPKTNNILSTDNLASKSTIKLTSPNGFSLDISITTERELVDVINAFLGGTR